MAERYSTVPVADRSARWSRRLHIRTQFVCGCPASGGQSQRQSNWADAGNIGSGVLAVKINGLKFPIFLDTVRKWRPDEVNHKVFLTTDERGLTLKNFRRTLAAWQRNPPRQGRRAAPTGQPLRQGHAQLRTYFYRKEKYDCEHGVSEMWGTINGI